MTAVSGASLRQDSAYWVLSGPTVNVNIQTCRQCKKSIMKNSSVMVREGRKLRFFYHTECFTGDADPRTQDGSSFNDSAHSDFHTKTAPKLSSLEGPKAYKDSDGRVLTRTVFKDKAPKQLGEGKWSVKERGYKPNLEAATNMSSVSRSASTRFLSGSVVSTMSGRSKSSIRTAGSNAKSSVVIR